MKGGGRSPSRRRTIRPRKKATAPQSEPRCHLARGYWGGIRSRGIQNVDGFRAGAGDSVTGDGDGDGDGPCGRAPARDTWTAIGRAAVGTMATRGVVVHGIGIGWHAGLGEQRVGGARGSKEMVGGVGITFLLLALSWAVGPLLCCIYHHRRSDHREYRDTGIVSVISGYPHVLGKKKDVGKLRGGMVRERRASREVCPDWRGQAAGSLCVELKSRLLLALSIGAKRTHLRPSMPVIVACRAGRRRR
ncbi:hypothetical protein NL676_002551 [Syzygium grande]|nr:hypothetical protein NL676_002551 [Syzygium grande]